MANSKQPLPLGVDPHELVCRTPGPLGINDAGSPFANACFVGDTPGPLGVSDRAEKIASGEEHEGSEHDHADEAHHLAHWAHQGHLGAEGVEFLAHQVHLASHYAGHLMQAMELMQAHSRMAVDLKLMKRMIHSLENRVSQSGTAKLAGKLDELKAAYSEAQSAFEAQRPAVAAASKFVQVEHDARVSLRGVAKIRLGRAALSFERALGGSAVGRVMLGGGKFVASAKFVKGLMIVGAALEAFAGWEDSNAQTTAGRAANAAAAGAGGALVMANPIVAGADLLAPKGFKLSEIYQGTAGALTAIGEGFVTEDSRAMALFHERSKRGDYGVVMKSASEAGDYWADKGLVGGLSEFWDAVKYSIDSWGK